MIISISLCPGEIEARLGLENSVLKRILDAVDLIKEAKIKDYPKSQHGFAATV